jgi:hypothetical protein
MSALLRDQENRRREVRHPTCLKARICYGPQGSVSIPCTIRNISNGGALIEAAEVSLLPVAFRLMNPSQGVAYDAKVVWRRGNQVGVALVGVAFSQTIDLKPKAGLGARALQAVRLLVKR